MISIFHLYWTYESDVAQSPSSSLSRRKVPYVTLGPSLDSTLSLKRGLVRSSSEVLPPLNPLPVLNLDIEVVIDRLEIEDARRVSSGR
mmetsp:Transcript_31777/g.66823  ORF Transcript_31777/g.66823 Transcript_31777/m.66823 type:complete len:88 (-) Transcript_31777:1092-1355(-)